MSGEETDDEDRSHDPSQKRLDDARERGDIARMPDLLTAAAYGGLLLASMTGAGALSQSGKAGAALLSQANRLFDQALAKGQPFFGGLTVAMILPLWPFFVLPGLAVLAVLLAQRGITFSAEKLSFKLSRINPIANAAQKFGMDGLVEFAKSLIKLLLTGVLLYLFLRAKGPEIATTPALGPAQITAVMLGLVVSFLAVSFAVQLGLGLVDGLWQRHRYLQRHRMSRKEMLDEAKDSEGDPHVKAQRRQKGQEIALNRMLADVPGADVVIVNPTHYAVALKWDRAAGIPPVCVAKGVDETARRIREKAAECGIPIRHDPPTARALHATVKLGEPIQPDHYRAVAAAIRFAEAMRKKARGRR